MSSYKCLIDGKTFHRKDALEKHNKDSHYKFEFKCKDCVNVFQYEGDYRKHVAYCDFKRGKKKGQPVASKNKII